MSNDLPANGSPFRHNLTPNSIAIASLKPLGKDTRRHSKKQVQKIAESLVEFGIVLPILLDEHNQVVAGWGVVEAARKLELTELPAVRLANLSETKARMLRLALNRLAEDSEWDREALALEFKELLDLEPDITLELTGFETAEMDLFLAADGSPEEEKIPALDEAPELARLGDVWRLGKHFLMCGDALDQACYRKVCGDERAQLVFTDPPYNVKIENNVSGLGAVKHRDFAMASGEMSREAFSAFLGAILKNLSSRATDGAVFYVCMDWRHQAELLAAIEATDGLSQLNLCVWNKTNGGMGSLYRSKHELVYVLKSGKASHINNIQLGKYGRNRANVWDYPGVNGFSQERSEALAQHPTVKPVAMIADAILDCSKRDSLILDPFGGAGSTLIAAEGTGRRAALIELEPRYVDVTLKRWEDLTGERPVLNWRDKGAEQCSKSSLLKSAEPAVVDDEDDFLT